ncbi:hypothetical protein B0J11DRAFT_428483 [Dendryphion nanum]|uniref:DUF7704 domain-containing protein n=1 Tax=Dendryphion nanum TaxID=256645 RepID=A0A9P9E6V3_9PLEO|nr:hypothetical protein B0J11DRAFT_428483 [Dendryphion nanum]
MPTQIPFTYRLFFTYLDPLICLWGAYLDFFHPSLILNTHIPSPTADIGHTMILRQRGGNMLNFGLISAVLLRYTTDIHIWNIVQCADLFVDITYLWAVWGVLDAQNRLAIGTWRVEDWVSVAITGTAAVLRFSFLLGVGLRRGNKTQKKI